VEKKLHVFVALLSKKEEEIWIQISVIGPKRAFIYFGILCT